MQTHTRHIDYQGRISIPTQIRSEIQLEPEDKVEISAINKNQILISKITHRCIICGKETERIYKNQFVCEQCVADLGTDGDLKRDS